jgi:LysM repeat protein
VLVLHLVAVGGIYAFHSIKAHRREADGTAVAANPSASKKAAPAQPAPVAPAQEAKAAAPAPVPAVAPASKQAVAVQQPAAAPAPVASAPVAQPAKPAASGGFVDKSLSAAPAAPSAVLPQPKAPAPTASTKAAAPLSAETAQRTYTVAKGDNPVTIAKKMGVSSEELLKLNGLEDPKKLQIGQVLKVPAKK